MSGLDQQFKEDKALRDAALGVLKADIEHAKTSLTGKAIADRMGSRIGDGAKDVVEIAKGHADDNRGILAVLIGALLLWFVREPILDLLGFGSASEHDSDPREPSADNRIGEEVAQLKDTELIDPAADETTTELVNDHE